MQSNTLEFVELVERYFNMKTEMESYKKQVDADNLAIKDVMRNEVNKDDKASADCNDLVANFSIITSQSFDEDKLLAKIKELGVKSCIKTKEYVDMDELENCIYNGELDAKELESCKVTKTQERLVVKKKTKKEKK